MKKHINKRMIIVIVIAALFNSIGQLVWKIGTTNSSSLGLYLLGFILIGIGIFVMIAAFKYEKISILQPIMATSFILSIFIGYFFLNEAITLTKVIGLSFIVLGVMLLNLKIPKKVRL